MVGFFRATELQGNGRAHLHVLVDVPESRLRPHLAALTLLAKQCGFGVRGYRVGGEWRGGFRVDGAGDPELVAGYVSKVAAGWYTAKAVQESQRAVPRYSRRAAWSRGVRSWAPGWRDPEPTVDPETGERLGFVPSWASVPTLTRALEASGFVVFDPESFRAGSGAAGPPRMEVLA